MKLRLQLRSLAGLLALALLAVPFNSCTDLEPEVFGNLTPANFPTGESDIVAAFASAYTNLYGYQNHGGYMSSIEVASDEIMIPQRGSDWFDGGIWLRQHRHEYLSTEPHLNGSWLFLYRGALQCNSVIQLIDGPAAQSALNDDQRNAFRAEMRALRALFYYWLIDAFGDVPLITGEEETVETEPTATPRADIFNFIVSELQDASNNLSRETGGATYARFNYYAAQGLLSRVLLNAETHTGSARYADAVAAANNAMSGPYTLEDDYHANFAPDNDNGLQGTSENMLVIPYDLVNAQGFNLPQMTLHYNSQTTFNTEEQPWNGYCSLQEFYESYDDDDKRKGVSGNQQVPGNFLAGPQFAPDGVTPIVDGTADDPGGVELVFTPEVNELEPGAFRQAGARVFKFRFPQGTSRNLPNDFPLVRLSEVMLNKAEALFRQNAGDSEALMLVNMVRSRAGVDDFNSLSEENLLAERGRELFFEGHRRTDLIRFGRYTGTWFEKSASPATREVFPIPQPQLNANRNLAQNPGY